MWMHCCTIKQLTTIRRRLLLQESIIEDIKNNYRNTQKEREKHIITKTSIGKFTMKYRLQRRLGFLKKQGQRSDGGLLNLWKKGDQQITCGMQTESKVFPFKRRYHLHDNRTKCNLKEEEKTEALANQHDAESSPEFLSLTPVSAS